MIDMRYVSIVDREAFVVYGQNDGKTGFAYMWIEIHDDNITHWVDHD